MSGAADAAFCPLPFPELPADGEERRKHYHTDHDCVCHDVILFISADEQKLVPPTNYQLPTADFFRRNIAQRTKRSIRIAMAVQTPNSPEIARRPNW